jgi:hypothetical protein
MKEKLRTLAIALMVSVMLTSCYAYTTVVGKGAQGATATTKWNNYVLWGLAPVGVSDPKVLAGGAEDYTVFTRHSFVNGLVAAITFGIYSPTTTTVTK